MPGKVILAGIFAYSVRNKLQITLGGNFGIHLPDGAGGGISRVNKDFAVVLQRLPVKFLESGFGQEYFAAHVQFFGRVSGCQFDGDGFDGFYRVRHIFADLTIAARSGIAEYAVVIMDG